MGFLSRIVLAAAGSLGDVHPYFALARALGTQGHNVAIVTSVFYRERIERDGFEFFPLRPDLTTPMNSSPEVSRRAHRMRDGTEYVLKTMVLPHIGEMYEDLLHAFRGADLVINHAVLFATPLAAEKLGIPWVSVILSPGILLSAYDPPILPPIAFFNRLRVLGPAPHRILHRFIDKVTHAWMKPVHDLRATAGLPRSSINPVSTGMFSPHGTLAMFSEVLGERQPDWPANVHVTGFVFFDDAAVRPMDPELAQYLDAGPPPVVFTLGSDAVTDAGGFYEQSLQAVQRIGCRAVFLTGHDPRNQFPAPSPEIIVLPYAPYSGLFPRAQAVVHSGGIGTIAQCLRAGAPMLVVPFAADQPDNGARIERRGLGHCLWRDRYTAARAEPLIRELIGNPRFRQQAQQAQQRIAQEDGIGNACAALQRILTATD